MRDAVLIVARPSERIDQYRAELVSEGFRVATMTDVQSGLRCLGALQPAVCVIDVCSLAEAGWQLCEAAGTIRTRRPLMLILADRSRESPASLRARARRLGAVVYARPLTPADLAACVATLVSFR